MGTDSVVVVWKRIATPRRGLRLRANAPNHRLPLLNGQPCTPMLHPSVGAHSDEAFPAVHSRSRPAFPSPAAPGSNRLRSGFPLELRTPPLPAAHVEVGTDPEHCPGY